MFHPTQSAQQTRATATSVARHNKKFWTAHNWAQVTTGQCCLPNNWISHWCKVSSVHWATLMQDTLDITGAGYEYNFVWLYTGYSILYSERIQHRSTTVVRLTGVQGCEFSPWQAKCDNWSSILLIFWYSVLFWSSVIWKIFDCCFPVISGFST